MFFYLKINPTYLKKLRAAEVSPFAVAVTLLLFGKSIVGSGVEGISQFSGLDS
jgi:hypothetical protein